METLMERLGRHEGRRSKPYFDCCGKPFKACRCTNQGKLSIGIGRNLEDVGLSNSEIDGLCQNDIDRAGAAAAAAFPWFKTLTGARRDVVVEMVFNLGIGGFQGFTRMIGALAAGDFDKAASEMLASHWSAQVGKRAVELAELMRAG